MRQRLSFGKSGLSLDLPDGFDYRVLEARSSEPLPDGGAEIRRAISSPTGSPPLGQLARGHASAAIAVCDITRPAPNREVLPAVLGSLTDAGISPKEIILLIATGLHRPATQAEIREICGEEIASNYLVENHDARALSQHRHLGTTRSGTPVYVDERFVSAGLHITLGLIEPHLMLGFSGGRKMVAPGLAAQETIKALHSPRFMRDPRAVEGSVENNPLHHELLEIARMARHDFIVDVALARDRSIVGVFAGHPEAAHRRGTDFVSSVMLQTLDEPVDAVITTAAGYPLDLTFYQAIKGVTAACHIVKPGGKILLMAACEEGAGAGEFREMLAASPSGRGFLDRIASAPVIVDQWQLEKLAMVTTRFEVLFYLPGLPPEYASSLWGPRFSSAEAALAALAASLPRGSRIAVIPEGPYVLARAAAPPRAFPAFA